MEDQGGEVANGPASNSNGLNVRHVNFRPGGPMHNLYSQDGYYYIQNKQKNGLIYLICQLHRSRACPGRGVIRRNGNFSISVPHHCLNRDLREEEIRSVERESLQNVPHREINNIPVIHENDARELLFERVQGQMNNWLINNVSQEMPTNLPSFARILNDGNYSNLKNYIGGTLHYHSVEGDGFSCVIIIDPEFSRELLEIGNFLFDISKTAIPSAEWCKLLLTLMCIKDGYLLSCAYALMSTETAEAYTAVFDKIRSIIPGFQITSAITNFSDDLQRSIRQMFPAATIRGSLHHFQEEVYKLAILHSIEPFLLDEHEHSKITRFIHFVFMLPLLPAHSIERTFTEKVQSLGYMDYALLQVFFLHFQRLWIMEMTPERFSAYRRLESCTDTFEHISNLLFSNIGNFPEVWQFAAGLLNLQAIAYRENAKINNGSTDIHALKIINEINSSNIRQDWIKLDQNELTKDEFLNRCRSLYAVSRITSIGNFFCRIQLNLPSNFNAEATISALQSVPEQYTPLQPLEEMYDIPSPLTLMRDINDDDDAPPPNREAINTAPHASIPEANEAAPPTASQEMNEQEIQEIGVCCLCQTAEATNCFLPCGHMATCAGCCEVYHAQNVANEDAAIFICPICRQIYTNTQVIIRQGECSACHVRLPSTTFIPCGHLALCQQCNTEETMINFQNKCSVCSHSFTDVKQIF